MTTTSWFSFIVSTSSGRNSKKKHSLLVIYPRWQFSTTVLSWEFSLTSSLIKRSSATRVQCSSTDFGSYYYYKIIAVNIITIAKHIAYIPDTKPGFQAQDVLTRHDAYFG